MRPTNPWMRPGRSPFAFGAPGTEPGARRRHPHDHPGRDRGEGPRRHHRGGPFERPAGPEFGPGPGPRRGGRRGRAGRGDVRTAILLLLAEQPMHGYQLMQAVADRTAGAWRLSPGAVYPTIAQLEDEGLVRVSTEGGRKLVALTEAGREHVGTLGGVDPFAAFTGDGERVDLRGAVGELMGAVHQLGRVGDPAQLAAAAKVLAEAKRSLYLLLAGEAPAEQVRDEAGEPPTPG
ncbi:PadR family transcriptional regulator [Geodermatophilus sp. SYSU D00815]